jgi:hypothetical protein
MECILESELRCRRKSRDADAGRGTFVEIRVFVQEIESTRLASKGGRCRGYLYTLSKERHGPAVRKRGFVSQSESFMKRGAAGHRCKTFDISRYCRVRG